MDWSQRMIGGPAGEDPSCAAMGSIGLIQAEDTMQWKSVAVGIAILIAVGIWQVQADQGLGAKQDNSQGAAELTRQGAYLVNEVAHCSHCHSPQDTAGMPDRARLLRGATLPIRPKKETKNWAEKSPDITSRGLAGKWSEEEMIKFLTTGLDPNGEKPAPPMPVFHLTRGDARAVFLYLKSLPDSQEGGDREKNSKNSE
jgi:mono/diheme cytochrome c family protein